MVRISNKKAHEKNGHAKNETCKCGQGFAMHASYIAPRDGTCILTALT